MEIGGGQGLTAPQVWSTPVRTLTADPATDAGCASLVWQHVSRLLTIGGAAIPSGSVQLPFTSATVSLTTPAVTNLINTSGTPGTLLTQGIRVTTTLVGGVATATLEYVIDGVLSIVLPIYTNAITFDPSFQQIGRFINQNGTLSGSLVNLALPIQFGSSLIVRLNLSATTLTAGAINMASLAFTHP